MWVSMYTPIWEKLKADKTTILEVENTLVARVKKAVIKTKDKDRGFKFINETQKCYLQITIKDSPRKGYKYITFVLKARFDIEPIQVTGDEI